MKAHSLQILGLSGCAFALSAMVGCGAPESEVDNTDRALKSPGSDTQPAETEKTAHYTGWHTVCADSLTLYNAGPIATIGRGAYFYIDHFGDGINHAWGWVDGHPDYYGWVYNGWFC